jgi:hypothetical protein
VGQGAGAEEDASEEDGMIIFTILCAFVLACSFHWANTDYAWMRKEYITGDGRCEYLTRWHFARGRNWSMYLHRFTGDDWSLDLHDHPKHFISIGVLGRYVEETEISLANARVVKQYDVYTAPWCRRFPPQHAHRLMLFPLGKSSKKRPCWTIVIVGQLVRDWGWWVPQHLWPRFSNAVGPSRRGANGQTLAWVNWERYVYNKGVADARKSCP